MTDRRDVLLLSHRVPFPPDRGDRITTYHLMRYFLERGDRVRVGALAEERRDLDAVAKLRQMTDGICCPMASRRMRKLTCLRGLFEGSPLTLPYFRNRELQRTVDRWMRDDPPDLVFVYSSSMAQYVTRHSGIPRIMHFAELDSDKWRQYAARRSGIGRWIYTREHKKLFEFESRVARSFEASVVVSEVEKDLFMEQIPDVTPWVLPNGVDVDHFETAGDERREPHTVIFTGVMDYEPNIDGVSWFCRECLPRIRTEFADARFLIVGNRPTPEVLQLAEHPGVEVTGWVPETPPWFDRATVAIAPLRVARGLQNKVLEAMSMRLPVVASCAAARGVGEVPGDTLLVADGVEDTTEAVLRLMRDPAEARATGDRAAAFIRDRFRWEHMFAIVERIVDALEER